MFNIVPKADCAAKVLNHSANVFHEALRLKESYYHVVTEDGGEYDIAYVKNNDLVPENYRNAKKGIDIYPSYFHYDENDVTTLDLSLLKEFRATFFFDLNEYSVAIARLALKYTDNEVYFINPMAQLFFAENERLHIVEKFPMIDESEVLQITDEKFTTGYFEGTFRKISSVPAFHSLFFWQSLTNLNLADIIYVEVPIAKNVGVGGILSYYANAEEFFSTKGWQIYLKENSTRYDDEMLRRYFRINKKPKEATPKNTIFLEDITTLVMTYFYSKIQAEIDENALSDKFRAEMDEYAEVVLGNHNTLGILIRGTDYIVSKMGGVRQQATVSDMLPKIREWLDADGYDLIFLATEDQDILERMRKEFGSMIRVISQVRHSVKDFGNARLLSELEKKESENDAGILEDTTVNYFYALYLLSKCQSFMVSGKCHGESVVKSFNHGKFKRFYRFQVGVKG
ncbi:MAG: hypothetical protein IJQ16_09065 [Selenomonadaceae bacterium]|nr:hypothetical protein [Selenomonadaceae bacterium]MBQ6976683.1 hypothetical protein [Selenomonadaceae bacterium]